MTLPSTRLQITPQAPGQLALSGIIDETSPLASLPGYAHHGLLRMDLRGVSFINSLGVRDWIRLLQQLRGAAIQLELVAVSEALIHQFNMIAAARGNATVKSFFAPYACDRCGRDESVLLDTTDHRSALEAGRAPSLPCSECGEPMAFNDFPERYFSFLVEGE